MKKILLIFLLIGLVAGVNAGWLEDSLGIPTEQTISVKETTVPQVETPKVELDKYISDFTVEEKSYVINKDGAVPNGISTGFKKQNNIVVFTSWADNIVSGVNKKANIFLKDIAINNTSVIAQDAILPSLSKDTKWIVYEYSPDPDHGVLPMAILKNISTLKEYPIGYTSGGNKYGWSGQTFQIADDGSWVIFNSTYPGYKAKTIRWYRDNSTMESAL